MSKKKKGKIVQLRPSPQSPENYIKTQARNLPVYECLVNNDWQEMGIANIIVARRHTTGNVTFGIYLVDLYCLGLKDTFYQFNVDEREYEELPHRHGKWEKCEYSLAHNIIYGAIAFAEDYGFEPAKEFKVSQYILEEDNENVELIELEFGKDGIPFYMHGPNDNKTTTAHIKATLNRTAGQGNFVFLQSIDSDDDLDQFEDYEDSEDTDDEDEIEEEIDQRDKAIEAIKHANRIYDEVVRTAPAKKKLQKSTIGAKYRITKNSVENEYRRFDYPEQELHYNQLLDLFYEGKFEAAIEEALKAVSHYPDKAPFYNLLQMAYLRNDETEKSDAIIFEMYQKFPGYLFAFVNYANLLMLDDDRFQELDELLDGKWDLNELYPKRNVFSEHEAAIYHATMCRYFMLKNDIDSADLYMDFILKNKLQFIGEQTLTTSVMWEMSEVKLEKIESKMSENNV